MRGLWSGNGYKYNKVCQGVPFMGVHLLARHVESMLCSWMKRGNRPGFFSHVAISSGASDHRSDPLVYNFNGMSKLYL